MNDTPLHHGRFTELPAPTQEHVDQLHPDLRQTMGDRLIQLSHLDFYQLEPTDEEHIHSGKSDHYTPYKPNDIEVKKEHQPQVDRVLHYMTAAAAALHRVHDTLAAQDNSEKANNPDALARSTCSQLINDALAEKQAGNETAALDHLETALVVQSLVNEDKDYNHRKTIVHEAVSKNLATELVQATKNTFGLVSITEDEDQDGYLFITPANRISQQSAKLLHVASDLNFSDNFSMVSPHENEMHTHRKRDLSCQDMLSLAEAKEVKGDKDEARELIAKAFPSELRQLQDPQTAVELLVKAEELRLPDLDDRLATLRTQRITGMKFDQHDPNSNALNQAIPRLIQQGHAELAEELISSSSDELRFSEEATQEEFGNSPETKAIVHAISDIHERKQQALLVTLAAHGAPAIVAQEILYAAADPDALLHVSSEFWDEYKKLGDTSEDALDLVYQAARLETPEAQAAYVQSAAEAWDRLAEAGLSGADITDAKFHLGRFQDQAAALRSLEVIFGGHDYVKDLNTLKHIFEDEYQPLIQLSEDFNPALRDLKGLVDDEDFVEAAWALLGHHRTAEEAAKALTALKSVVARTDNNKIIFNVLRRSDPEHIAATYALVDEKLQKYGESLRTVTFNDTRDLIFMLGTGPEEEEKFREVARRTGIRREVTDHCEADWRLSLEATDRERPPKPELSDFPAIQQYLSELGLEPELAATLFATWSSVDNYPINLQGLTFDKGIEQQFKKELNRRVEDLVSQVYSLANHIETYGVEETTLIIETFGIHNFKRYGPDQLHEQLVEWNAGNVPPKNLVISARYDHNFFLQSTGKEYTKSLGEDGIFFFEASNKTELAKIAVAVGHRERSAQRQPALQNVVIAAHGAYFGLQLGENEFLHIDDYVVAAQKRDKLKNIKSGQLRGRPNTFTRHLGQNFRIILHACETGGIGGIANRMYDTHGHRTEGGEKVADADRRKVGSNLVIEPNGDVFYWHALANQHLPTTVYDNEKT